MKVLIFLNHLLSLKLKVGQLPLEEQGVSGAGETSVARDKRSLERFFRDVKAIHGGEMNV